jgi:outer membrane protein W
VEYRQVFNRMTASVHTALGPVKTNLWLDPAVVSVTIVYKF